MFDINLEKIKTFVSDISSKGLFPAMATRFPGGPTYTDMIWRPGQSPIAVSPEDTIVASKGGMAGVIVINQTNNFSVSNPSDYDRLTREISTRIVDDVKRQVKF